MSPAYAVVERMLVDLRGPLRDAGVGIGQVDGQPALFVAGSEDAHGNTKTFARIEEPSPGERSALQVINKAYVSLPIFCKRLPNEACAGAVVESDDVCVEIA